MPPCNTDQRVILIIKHFQSQCSATPFSHHELTIRPIAGTCCILEPRPSFARSFTVRFLFFNHSLPPHFTRLLFLVSPKCLRKCFRIHPNPLIILNSSPSTTPFAGRLSTTHTTTRVVHPGPYLTHFLHTVRTRIPPTCFPSCH